MGWAESHTVDRTVQSGAAGISGEGLVTPQPLLPGENINLKAQPEGHLWVVTAVLVKQVIAALFRGTLRKINILSPHSPGSMLRGSWPVR